MEPDQEILSLLGSDFKMPKIPESEKELYSQCEDLLINRLPVTTLSDYGLNCYLILMDKAYREILHECQDMRQLEELECALC